MNKLLIRLIDRRLNKLAARKRKLFNAVKADVFHEETNALYRLEIKEG